MPIIHVGKFKERVTTLKMLKYQILEIYSGLCLVTNVFLSFDKLAPLTFFKCGKRTVSDPKL